VRELLRSVRCALRQAHAKRILNQFFQGGPMKRLMVFFAGMAMTALAQAGGYSYSVDSFKTAQELCRQTPSKHVLVYYTAQLRS